MKVPLKIEINDLKMAANALFEHLEKGGVKEIQLKEDYYWEIDAKELYDATKDPKDLTVGSLYTDWEFLKKIADVESEPVTLNFIKLAALLRYLGDSMSETDLAK